MPGTKGGGLPHLINGKSADTAILQFPITRSVSVVAKAVPPAADAILIAATVLSQIGEKIICGFT